MNSTKPHKTNRLADRLYDARQQLLHTRPSIVAFSRKRVAVHHNLEWLNDAASLTVNSTLQTLQSIRGSIIWIVNPESNSTDFTPLKSVVNQQVRLVISYGSYTTKLVGDLFDSLTYLSVVNGLNEAIHCAIELANAGDTVVFSPANPSIYLRDPLKRAVDFNRLLVHQISNQPLNYGSQKILLHSHQ